PDGLGRGDVLVHDGAENCRLAVVQHLGNRAYRVLTALSDIAGQLAGSLAAVRCQCSSGAGATGDAVPSRLRSVATRVSSGRLPSAHQTRAVVASRQTTPP